MKKTFILLAFFAVFSVMPKGFITAAVAQDNAIWIDVRSEKEWQQGHLKGAVLIPYDKIVAKIQSIVKNKRQPINLYSAPSGRRAEIALKALEQMGYINVQNRGSYESLLAQGKQ